MNTSSCPVNCEKNVLFLEFAFSDIPKFAFPVLSGQSSLLSSESLPTMLGKDLYPAIVATLIIP